MVTAAREVNRPYEESWALATLVRLHCQLGDDQGASVWHAHLVELMGHAGVTPDGTAAGLRAAAVYALQTRDHERALAAAEEALQLTERYAIPAHRAEAAVILGHARAAMRQPAAAARAYEQALAWYATSGNTAMTSEPQAGLAQLALARGDHTGALGWWTRWRLSWRSRRAPVCGLPSMPF